MDQRAFGFPSVGWNFKFFEVLALFFFDYCKVKIALNYFPAIAALVLELMD